jgi:hypothetical protein
VADEPPFNACEQSGKPNRDGRCPSCGVRVPLSVATFPRHRLVPPYNAGGFVPRRKWVDMSDEIEPPYNSEVNLLDLPCAACQRDDHDDCDNGYPDLGWPECKCEVCNAE